VRVLGVVPARGGSKGVSQKNLAPLLGKPLLAYTALCAREAKRLDRIVLSTEDEEIATVGQEWGLEVPFLRPRELATDEAPTLGVLQHAIRELESAGDQYDVVVTLQPTSPLRRPDDIDGAIGLLEETAADSVVSLIETGGAHPLKMKVITGDGLVEDAEYAQGMCHVPRQNLPKYFALEGSLYVTRRDVLMGEGRILGRKTRAWVVPRQRSVNVDEPFDLWLAEVMLRDRPWE